MFGHLTLKYTLMLRKHAYYEAVSHVDAYAFFRIPALKNAYALSKKEIRRNLIDTLVEIAMEQPMREMALYTNKIMFGLLGQPGVDMLFEKKFARLFEDGDFEEAVFEVLLDFKARSVPFKMAFDGLYSQKEEEAPPEAPAEAGPLTFWQQALAFLKLFFASPKKEAEKETKKAPKAKQKALTKTQKDIVAFLHARLEAARLSWDQFFDQAEVLALLDSDFVRDTVLSLQYAALLNEGQYARVLADVAKSHDARLPLLYDALELVDDDVFSALIALAETLINDDSAATRLMARNLLRKYS